MPERDTEEPGRPEPADAASPYQRNLASIAKYATVSYTLIGAIVLLGGLGYLADQRFGTEPWLLLTGLLLGIVVGFYELARVIWGRRP